MTTGGGSLALSGRLDQAAVPAWSAGLWPSFPPPDWLAKVGGNHEWADLTKGTRSSEGRGSQCNLSGRIRSLGEAEKEPISRNLNEDFSPLFWEDLLWGGKIKKSENQGCRFQEKSKELLLVQHDLLGLILKIPLLRRVVAVSVLPHYLLINNSFFRPSRSDTIGF